MQSLLTTRTAQQRYVLLILDAAGSVRQSELQSMCSMSCLRPGADLTKSLPKAHNLRRLSLLTNALQVLYLDVQPGDGQQQLVALAAAVREHFSSQGVGDDCQRPFTPHVTIAKMSNITSFGARKRLGKVPEVTAFHRLDHCRSAPGCMQKLQPSASGQYSQICACKSNAQSFCRAALLCCPAKQLACTRQTNIMQYHLAVPCIVGQGKLLIIA